MADGINCLRGRRYGLLQYRNTQNLGDEIQSIAARQYFPHVDCLLDRDALHRRPGLSRRRVQLILNGWFTHRPDHWPPHPLLEPLILSLHLSDFAHRGKFSAAEALVVGRNAQYLKEHAPIGARDLWTLELLQRNGIDSYFSGCLTLTLQRPTLGRDGEHVVLNDLSDELSAAVQSRVKSPVVKTTHEDRTTSGFRARMARAEALLCTYAGARCVITSRLHCALPCLAMGVPVLLIPSRESINRHAGLLDLIHHCKAADLIAGRADFDPANPPQNPQRHLALRASLAARCASFFGGRIQFVGRA